MNKFFRNHVAPMLIDVAYTALRQIFKQNGAFDEIKRSVAVQEALPDSGDAKRQRVITTTKKAYQGISTIVIDAIIHVVLLRLRGPTVYDV